MVRRDTRIDHNKTKAEGFGQKNMDELSAPRRPRPTSDSQTRGRSGSSTSNSALHRAPCARLFRCNLPTKPLPAQLLLLKLGVRALVCPAFPQLPFPCVQVESTSLQPTSVVRLRNRSMAHKDSSYHKVDTLQSDSTHQFNNFEATNKRRDARKKPQLARQ